MREKQEGACDRKTYLSHGKTLEQQLNLWKISDRSHTEPKRETYLNQR